MATLSDRLAERLVTWRWALLGLAVIAAALAYWPAQQVTFDRSIEKMFAPDDPLLPAYRHLKEVFGGNEIVMAVYVDPELLDPDGSGIRRLAALHQRLRGIPGVRDVFSLDRPLGELIVAPHNPIAQRMRDIFTGYTHGADGKTVAAVCMLDASESAAHPRRETIAAIRVVMENLPDGLAPGLVTGEPVMVEDGFRQVEADGRRLGMWTTVLLGATIVLCFRSLRWVLAPLLVVQLTLLLTRACLGALHLQLTMVSSMLTAIVTVVGIATVVHVIVRVRELRMAGATPRAALTTALSQLTGPIIWSCVTDVAGFGSLIFSEVGPVRDFGVMTAVGALLVLVSVPLLVPGIGLLGTSDRLPSGTWGERRLSRELQRWIDWVQHRPRTISGGAVVLIGLSVAGVLRLEVETDFTKNFRRGSRIVESYQFVETNLGGAGAWDVILPAPPTLDWDYARRVLRLEERLRTEVLVTDEQGHTVPGLTKVLSLADSVVALLPKEIGLFRLAAVRNGVVPVAVARMRQIMPAFVDALHAADSHDPNRFYYRIMLRARERQPADQKTRLVAAVTQLVNEELALPDWQRETAPPLSPPSSGRRRAEVTGYFVLLTKLIESLVRDQWVTFGIASIGVGLTLLIAFRSPTLALVALVPNALPIFLVLGTMGWLSLPINMGAAMIAAVSMGLSVDSSIHYLTSFRQARRAGQSVGVALAVVQQSVGRAMVFSTLALIVGFSVLGTSEFVPTIYFGLLVSLAMLGGLFGNLLVLPLLLRLVTREADSQSGC